MDRTEARETVAAWTRSTIREIAAERGVPPAIVQEEVERALELLETRVRPALAAERAA